MQAAMTMLRQVAHEPTVQQLNRRLDRVGELITATGPRETKLRVCLVLVHEAVRRQLVRADNFTSAEVPQFDAERWDQDDHGRLAAYEDLIGRVRERTIAAVPADARVAMVSRGDDRLLQLDERMAVHFPQQADGRYAGFYPQDAAQAIAQLRALRSGGTQYVVFPATAFWWLDHYTALAEWLASSVVWACDDCSVFELPPALDDKEGTA